jgi:ubiquitin carboxyl-terminal hydrolase 5/13
VNHNHSALQAPGPHDKVYKDECVVSFDSPESDDGLYVCLQTWAGVGAGFLAQHHRMTGQPLYLRIKKTRYA